MHGPEAGPVGHAATAAAWSGSTAPTPIPPGLRLGGNAMEPTTVNSLVRELPDGPITDSETLEPTWACAEDSVWVPRAISPSPRG